MKTEVVNSVAQLKTALHLNYSNSALSQVFSSAALKSIRQNQTALSSCEAEIMATKKCATELHSIKHRAKNIGITEAYSHTKIYNDNNAAVQWAASVTSKGIKHLNSQ